MSHHTVRLGNSKLRKDSGRDIGERGAGGGDWTVAKEHAGDQGVVHAVIAAPEIAVVLEDIGGEVAEDSLPSGAIATVVAHEEIGPLPGVWSLIDLAGAIDASDGDDIILRITHAQQLFSDLPYSRIRLDAGFDDSLTLASAQIQVQPIQAEAVGAGAAPVHIGKGLGLVRTRLALESDVAVVKQPGIEVERAIVGRESVVGEDQESSAIIQSLQYLPQHLIDLLVKLRQRRAELGDE